MTSKARQLASEPNQQQAGRRNLIINGAMQVAQRGTSFTAPTNSSYTLDRIRAYQSGGGVYNVEQVTDAPSGFANSFKTTVTTTDDPASSDYYIFQYRFEGTDTAQLAYGTADAKTVTLSFWVKSSVTGQYGLAFTNGDSTYTQAKGYTINSANTWEYKTVTVSGATSGTWTNLNTADLKINFDLGSGSTFLVAGDTWFSGNAHSVTGQVDWINNTGATFQITGVQLELGSVATPFEHRSYGEELALCQRYYEVRGDGTTDIGGGTDDAVASFGYSFPNKLFVFPFSVTKRATPTVNAITTTGSGNHTYTSTTSTTTLALTSNYKYVQKIAFDAEL